MSDLRPLFLFRQPASHFPTGLALTAPLTLGSEVLSAGGRAPCEQLLGWAPRTFLSLNGPHGADLTHPLPRVASAQDGECARPPTA